ncbi:D-alanyl-D-alanine carboxypeptidase [Shigella flexneri]
MLIDTSIFASHDEGRGSPWNDLTPCFSAPPAPPLLTATASRFRFIAPES